MVRRLQERLRQRYRRWVDWRLPGSRKIYLNSNRLFIFPTRVGLYFIVVLVVIWLVATNFENNLVFGAAFLLSAMFVVVIFHTFLNLSGLSIEAGRAYSCFCGGRAEFGILLRQKGHRFRDSIDLHYSLSDKISTSLPGTELTTVSLAVPANKRGWFSPGRVTVETIYPLGLLRAWVPLDLNMRALIYPRPVDAQGVATSAATGHGEKEISGGSEDFRGLEKYRPGEPLNHIAWKHYAQQHGLLTKQYADPVDEQVWLDWDAFPGLDTEARLSRLCGWLIKVSSGSGYYGLRIPGIELAPARGDAHRDGILRELALFGLPAEQ